jgi:hypothetical protein
MVATPEVVIMQKFILRRGLKTIQKKEVEAEDFQAAVAKLRAFENEPVPYDATIMDDYCNIEYIGDVE